MEDLKYEDHCILRKNEIEIFKKVNYCSIITPLKGLNQLYKQVFNLNLVYKVCNLMLNLFDYIVPRADEEI